MPGKHPSSDEPSLCALSSPGDSHRGEVECGRREERTVQRSLGRRCAGETIGIRVRHPAADRVRICFRWITHGLHHLHKGQVAQAESAGWRLQMEVAVLQVVLQMQSRVPRAAYAPRVLRMLLAPERIQTS